MSRESELLEEIRALQERLSRLTEASLRINESLDFQAVLQGVLDSACSLTGSRYGVITLLDPAGQVEDFLYSGMTSEESALFSDFPEGMVFFEYLSRIEEPLRLRDFHAHVRALGFPEFTPPFPVSAVLPFLGVPIRHMGERIGAFYVGETEASREFTPEDEKTLVMFASQAALVIANARRHREEQRARADLETLVDTAPVGVAVFDVKTDVAILFNQEMARILDGLRAPGSRPGLEPEVFIIRRADGREITVSDLNSIELMSVGETVRAEEMELRGTEGQSVTVLMNATPIRTEGGEVETYIVTLQDMTMLQELERLRAEFLAMVSHELRTPLTSILGSATALLDEASNLHPAEVRQFHRIIIDQTHRMRGLIADLLDVARIETGTLSVTPEPTDLAVLMDEARTAFLSVGHKHNLEVDLAPDLPWLMADRSRMIQVLGNLLANAARHSPESTAIRVSAVRTELHVAVSVSDEGRGIPADSLPHLFRKFSRIAAEDQGGDTGLGLAVCKGIVEAHGGRIWAESEGPGLGARFTFTLPTVEEAGFVSPAVPPQISASTVRWQEREQVRILVVDDDPQALRYIRDALVKAGYAPIATAGPQEALGLVQEQKPHLVLLDLMLPGVDGIELMKEIVEERDVPVIFVSAYGQDQLVTRAFEIGAADYVVKPFSPNELIARIRAALRRRETAEPSAPYVVEDLVIDYEERLVTLAGSPVPVTAIEYRMLLELSAKPGRVLTYEHLLQRVWGDDNDGDVRPMRTVISEIRRKLGDDANNPTYIFTEPRVGYKMPRAEGLGPGPTAAH